MKKLKIFQLTIIILFVIFIFFFFSSTNYTKEYEVNDIDIIESYDKDSQSYYFTLTYNNITFDYLYASNYKHTRTFIDDIDIIKDEENFCLIPNGHTLEFIPLCIENNTITHYQKVGDNLKEQIPKSYLSLFKELNETYEDITIYNKDYTYYLWNYNGFYFINDKETKKVELFDKELYNANLIAYTKDYLLIADYQKQYTFDKFYRLDLKNGNIKEFNLDRTIYFDSYFPGYDKNKLYIVDNKEEVMYEFNAKNGNLKKIDAQILNNDKWEKVGIKSLINQNKTFSYPSNYEYILDNNKLYLKYTNKDISTLIDEDITCIIRIKDKEIFYLKTDTLYVFNPQKGSIKLLNYFEWNFNYNNMIYVN